jgi:nitrite reductase/ring-hydroxylating ferredoxin subunit
MPGYVKLATLDELPPGATKEVEHDGRIYALFNIGGEISVLDGICPHQGGPLAEGELHGTVVTCPWHGWQFDVRTGQALLASRVRQPTFPVRIEGQDVLVAVP